MTLHINTNLHQLCTNFGTPINAFYEVEGLDYDALIFSISMITLTRIYHLFSNFVVQVFLAGV